MSAQDSVIKTVFNSMSKIILQNHNNNNNNHNNLSDLKMLIVSTLPKYIATSMWKDDNCNTTMKCKLQRMWIIIWENSKFAENTIT